ncbi:MAG: tRNA pseudouridine(55) synthase TruB [Candidatus Rokubacteria bacterium 13_1_40CM_2_68_8]|nr:MAG: tRNA pseudouridine(55) synthase TruB [Candidatus Rokubacteria bacterium 13_1_40CM_2_68_8]
MSHDSVRSGVLVVDKGRGTTSFDVVAIVRRRLGVRRIGHAGTLDPDATGVLPILVGEATKLTPYLVDQDKEYLATVRFGLTTDTHDVSGRVLSETPVGDLARAPLEEACRTFVGRIKQIPPMYSAIHHEGRRLYELARAGIEVERAPREVIVRSIRVETLVGSRATLQIVCGKGTYVRALAADIGAALGCGGAVESLIRCRVGPFDLEEAVSWSELTTGRSELWSRVRPAEAALAGWLSVRLDGQSVAIFTNGQPADVVPAVTAGRGFVRVHAAAGPLIGVGELTTGGSKVRPVRILHADRPGTRVLPA